MNARFAHIALAFIIALVLPALLMAFSWNSYQYELYQAGKGTFEQYLNLLQVRFLFVYQIGLFLALIVGVPVFYFLRKRLPFEFVTVCIIAGFIAILPNLLIEFFWQISNLFDDSSTFSYQQGGCTIIEDNRRTLCGWIEFLLNDIGMVALHGMIGGVVFWLILTREYLYKIKIHFPSGKP